MSFSKNENDKNGHVVSNNLNMFQPVSRIFKFLELRPINVNPLNLMNLMQKKIGMPNYKI